MSSEISSWNPPFWYTFLAFWAILRAQHRVFFFFILVFRQGRCYVPYETFVTMCSSFHCYPTSNQIWGKFDDSFRNPVAIMIFKVTLRVTYRLEYIRQDGRVTLKSSVCQQMCFPRSKKICYNSNKYGKAPNYFLFPHLT